MRANINRLDTFGKVKISYTQILSIVGIKASDINSSNTDIRIIPYYDPNSGEILNLTKY